MRPEEGEIMLGLLDAIAADATRTQRLLASDLGIALGLVNIYLKRCVKKGLIKISEAPTRRYSYYLTPKGFAEKSRLTVDYLSHSFSFFRRARGDCADILYQVQAIGGERIVLVGLSDLAEIALICSLEKDISIVAIVDDTASCEQFAGVSVVPSYDDLLAPFDALVVTDVRNAATLFDRARSKFGAERVFAPRLLGLSARGRGESGS